ERPGALHDFLAAIGGRWNISLFHYRNHGAAYGRVLVGLQVPKAERAECRRKLNGLGYEYSDETRNPAYALFLGTQPNGSEREHETAKATAHRHPILASSKGKGRT